MFKDLKPYPEYIATESPWLRQVPKHWSMPRMKSVVSEISDKGYPDEPLLAATQSRGVIRKDQYENRTVEATKALDTLKRVLVDDFVISLRSFQGGIERAYSQGIISPAYTILRAKDDASRDYFTLLFKSSPFVDALRLAVTGIREGQNIEYPRLARDPIPVPPVEEQEAIVMYLAHAHQRINKAIATKRRLISLLEEQQRAVTSEAVRGALTSSAELIDSGIPYVGRVPADWRVERLGWHIYLLAGFPFESSGFIADTDGIRLLRGANVGVGGVAWDNVVHWPAASASGMSAFSLTEGDLVLGLDRPVIRGGVRVARVSTADVPSLLVQRVARLRARPTLESEFLRLALAGRGFTDYLAPIFTGISVPHLSPKQVCDFRLAVPPIEEQRKIVARVADAHLRLASATEVARQEIRLLEEFRTRLTADVVTGQVDVRSIEASLPSIDLADVFAASEDAADTDDDETADGADLEDE
ncbi:hypothetical protein ACFT2C_05685 [Promicromonospora sp. NPDC057138]|uniref:hypothetical protein n=1 Tax=Promicromonospora sp. NPDC057138 TaxID=3346031 RepID=UPI00362BCAC0